MVRTLGGYLQSSDQTHLNSGVEEVDPLRYLQVAPGSVIEGLEIRICLQWSGCIISSVPKAAPRFEWDTRNTHPKHLLDKVSIGTRNVSLSATGIEGTKKDVRTGESRTEPTELRFVLRRNSSPICRMISVKPSGQLSYLVSPNKMMEKMMKFALVALD